MNLAVNPVRTLVVFLAILSFSSFAIAQDEVGNWDKAVSLYKQSQYRESIVEFRKVINEIPTHSESWKFMGLAYFQVKEYDLAAEALTKAYDLKKADGRTDNDILSALSRCYIGSNKFEKALPRLEALVKQQPEAANNFYLLGVAYANLQRPSDAVTALKNAVKLDPHDMDSWYYMAALQLKNKMTDDAIVSLKGAVAASPKNVEMITLLTETQLRKAVAETDPARSNLAFEEAIKSANKLKSVRDDGVSAELLGRIYLAAKRYTSAELTLSRALTLTKEPTANLYFNLGLAHAQNKSYARAAEMLLQADRLGPGNVDTLNYLGFVYENLRKFQMALDAYSRAFELSGRSNQEIKEAIDRVTPFAHPQ